MNYRKKVEELSRKNPEEIFEEFITTLRDLYKDCIKGRKSIHHVMKVTDYWYASYYEFSHALERIDPKVRDLGVGIDLGDPKFSKEKKMRIVKEMLQRAEEILKNYKKRLGIGE